MQKSQVQDMSGYVLNLYYQLFTRTELYLLMNNSRFNLYRHPVLCISNRRNMCLIFIA